MVLGDADNDGRMDVFVSRPREGSTGESCTAYGVGAGGAVAALWSLDAPDGLAADAVAVADAEGAGRNKALVRFTGHGAPGAQIVTQGAGITRDL
ncbi:MAG TPA: hypothetical protein PLS90_05500, partial [Candidatus Sumerlaeota bacterium]|nr:hypothetical protein [Candidatus Sumerlaeota bacterium]